MIHHPFALAFLAANLLVTTGLLIAPYTVAPESAIHLDGFVGLRDHADRWAAFPLLPRTVYGFGDLVCHQMEDRSLHAHGNQFPVDARMLAMFVAGNLGFLWVLRTPARPWARDMAADLLPPSIRNHFRIPERRRWALIGLLLLGLVPTALDGGLQLATPYESTNPLRLATGTLLGFFGAAWLALVFDALAHPGLALASAPPTKQDR